MVRGTARRVSDFVAVIPAKSSAGARSIPFTREVSYLAPSEIQSASRRTCGGVASANFCWRRWLKEQRRAGLHAIIAVIDADNEPSIRPRGVRFRKSGHFRQTGFKFGRWLDVVYMEKLV